jgi:hypothetical protein
MCVFMEATIYFAYEIGPAGFGGKQRRYTYYFHGGVYCDTRDTLFEVLGARIYFPEREYAHEGESTGMQDYDRVCGGVQLGVGDRKQYETD